MNKPDESFEKLVEKLARAPREPFKPGWWHNEEGDLIEAYFSDEAYVGHWINPQVTLLEAADGSGRIVGVMLEGVKKGLKRGFGD